LADFSHEGLGRDFKWDLMQADWIADSATCIGDPKRREIIEDIIANYGGLKRALAACPKQAIHNDANDYNILVSGRLIQPRRVSGLIDLGDMCAAPRICDLAIAAAYIVLDHPHPEAALAALVAGYHEAYPLLAAEVDMIWPLLRTRLAVSVVNSTLMAVDYPDDPYVTISQAPAWRFLESHDIHPGLLSARLRAACGLPVVDGAERVEAWLEQERGNFAPLIGCDIADAPLGSLSVKNAVWPQNPFHMPLEEAARVDEEFCRLGDPSMNGGWAPHVHFQLALTTEGIEADWPGVGGPDEMYLWRAVCPNPAALLNLPDETVHYCATDKAKIKKGREDHFGSNLSLTYDEPVMLVRGWKHHLFDEWG